MARTLLSDLLVPALAAVLAVPAFAQQQPEQPSEAKPAAAAATNTSPIFAPKSADNAAPANPNPNAAPRRRAISPEASAALSAVTPKYAPPPPRPEPKPESEQVDMRDVDKPRNAIPRLPKYIVTEQKPAVFSERAITTDKGLADIAVRRYISDLDRALNGRTIPLFGTSMEARALAMYAEDERLKNISDLRANAVDAAKSDPAAGAYILRATRDTYMRTSDFGWNGGSNK